MLFCCLNNLHSKVLGFMSIFEKMNDRLLFPDDDQTHWQALKQGDTAAFSALYTRYAKLLLAYGRKIHDNRQLVADGVQELFAYLWTRRSHLGEAPSVKFYLLKSLRTILIKEIKKNSKVDFDLPKEVTVSPSNREYEMIHEEKESERNRLIKNALKDLSKREREVLYLKYFSNCTNEEIAELLEIKYQSVKNVSVTALKKLKKHLSSDTLILVLSHGFLWEMV